MPNLTPNIQPFIKTGADRSANPGDISQACILKKIIYPTGGYDFFTYESNKFRIYNPGFTSGHIDIIGGGIRIKQIDRYDPVSAKTKIQSYTYDSIEGSFTSGRIINFPLFAKRLDYQASDFCYYVPGPPEDTTFMRFSNGQSELGTTQGSHVGYMKVTVSNSGYGKDVYTFDVPGTFGVTDPIFKRSTARPYVDYYGVRTYWNNYCDFNPFPPNPNYDWCRGQVLTQDSYNEGGHKLKSVVNTYTIGDYKIDTATQHLKLYKLSCVHVNPEMCGVTYTNNYSYYNDYCILSGWKYLKNQEVYTYDTANESNYVKESTTYDYDNKIYKQLSKIQTIGSDLSTSTTEYTYPYHYTNKPGFIQTLMDKYITSAPIEVVSNIDGKFVQGKISIYNANGKVIENWAIENQIPLTSIIYSKNATTTTFIKDTHYKKQQSYVYNSTSGKLVCAQKENGLASSYIWGYNNTYPIAEIKNAGTNECGYTGFENYELNGWSTTGAWTSGPPFVKTGTTAKVMYGSSTKTFDIGNSALNHYGYKASVWVINGINNGYIEIGITGQTPIRVYNTGAENEWHLLEVELPKVKFASQIDPNLKITVTFGSTGSIAIFDDLRFYPMDAQMTTYTYDPLIGVTSVSDINNKPTIYTYDTFNRLWYIKDNLGNILKKYDYHYKP